MKKNRKKIERKKVNSTFHLTMGNNGIFLKKKREREGKRKLPKREKK